MRERGNCALSYHNRDFVNSMMLSETCTPRTKHHLFSSKEKLCKASHYEMQKHRTSNNGIALQILIFSALDMEFVMRIYLNKKTCSA